MTALKSYGQHFLNDKNVLQHILDIIKIYHNNEKIIEIGPGMGALTSYLIHNFPELTCVEVDKRCIEFLTEKYKNEQNQLTIIDADFLKLDLNQFIQTQTAIVGNFPYNISSQIVFRIIDNYEQIPFMVGMFQKEMAERIASPHGSKEYGVISVLTQLYYDVKLEFDIAPNSFSPPPKVMSSIISLKRKENIVLDFDIVLFKKVVKAGFSQRRKMLRNGLSGMVDKEFLQQEIFTKRAEQLSLQDFIDLTKMIEKNR
ncbi:MAG: 16S rRNA (adenine(1518)-N(6)/adenine(1519)-N(6))-dimethyltransferase RsmA [Chitinophagales bacterium]